MITMHICAFHIGHDAARRRLCVEQEQHRGMLLLCFNSEVESLGGDAKGASYNSFNGQTTPMFPRAMHKSMIHSARPCFRKQTANIATQIIHLSRHVFPIGTFRDHAMMLPWQSLNPKLMSPPARCQWGLDMEVIVSSGLSLVGVMFAQNGKVALRIMLEKEIVCPLKQRLFTSGSANMLCISFTNIFGCQTKTKTRIKVWMQQSASTPGLTRESGHRKESPINRQE